MLHVMLKFERRYIHLNTHHFWGFGYLFVKFQGRNPTNQTVRPLKNRWLVLPEKERVRFLKHQFSSGFSAVGFREGKFLKNTIPETNIGAENWWLEDEFLFGYGPILGGYKLVGYLKNVGPMWVNSSSSVSSWHWCFGHVVFSRFS